MDREGANQDVRPNTNRTGRFFLPDHLRQALPEGRSTDSSQTPVGSQRQTQEQDQSKAREIIEVRPTMEAAREQKPTITRFYRPQIDTEREVARPGEAVRSPGKATMVQEGSRQNPIVVDGSMQKDGLKRGRPQADGNTIEKGTTRVRSVIEVSSKKKSTGKAKLIKRVARKSATVSDGKITIRPSLKAPEDEEENYIGYNIPNAIYKRIIKEIAVSMDFGSENERTKIGSESITYLKIAAENFLISRYRLASLVRKARGRKTLKPIDMETVDLILDEPFLRRRSCPNVIIR